MLHLHRHVSFGLKKNVSLFLACRMYRANHALEMFILSERVKMTRKIDVPLIVWSENFEDCIRGQASRIKIKLRR